MKILYASRRPPYPFFLGGAARSAHNMLNVLGRDLSCECLSIGARDFAPDSWKMPNSETHDHLNIRSVGERDGVLEIDCGYPVELHAFFQNALKQKIRNWRPDLIWTQLDGIEEVATIGLRAKVPTIVFFRDAEDSVPTIERIARSSAAIICNSSFMAGRIRELTGKTPHVIYPSFDPMEGAPAGEGGFITLINPHRVKGLETFLQIAKRLTDERFMVVESWPMTADDQRTLLARIAHIGNIEFSHRVPRIETIYGKTKLLVVPSIWEEAFGRVVIEAQSFGIPVIASERGGLPEAVGDGGICIRDYLDAETWSKEIRSLLADRERYESLSRAAKLHARSDLFSTQHAAQSFFHFASDLIRTNNEKPAQGFNFRCALFNLLRRKDDL